MEISQWPCATSTTQHQLPPVQAPDLELGDEIDEMLEARVQMSLSPQRDDLQRNKQI